MTISELRFHTAPEHCVLAAVVHPLESSWMQLGVPVQSWWWIYPQWQVFDCRPWLEAALLLGELSLPSWQDDIGTGSLAFLSLWTHTHTAELKCEHSSMQIHMHSETLHCQSSQHHDHELNSWGVAGASHCVSFVLLCYFSHDFCFECEHCKVLRSIT